MVWKSKEEDIRKLPDKKIKEAFRKCAGEVKECPRCGELTAFLCMTGHNGKSSCHNCGYTEEIIG